MFNEEEDTKRIFGADNTMGLFVALYLILLAFFIILTSFSNQAVSRSALAMESVNQTFKRTTKTAGNVETSQSMVPASQDVVLKSIQQRFLEELEIEGRFSEAGNGSLEVRFSQDYLFEPGSLKIRRDVSPFLDQVIAVALDPSNPGSKEIAFMFGSGEGPVARDMTRSQEIAIRRAGELARYLQLSGLEKGAYTTGFVAIPEGEILAVFARRSSQVLGFATERAGG